jgi:transcriptional regulator with XRE-family HTH domain
MGRCRYTDLADYFKRSGDTQENAALIIGCRQAYLSRVAAGRIVPRPAAALRIAHYADIPLESFTLQYLARRGAVRKRRIA